MKVLTPRAHGYVDYALIALLAIAPIAFGIVGTPATAAWVIAAWYLSLAVMTRYPLGLVKAIPFTVHAGIEAATALALVAMPWILGFADDRTARSVYLAAGASLAALWLLTNYRAADVPHEKIRMGRRAREYRRTGGTESFL